MFFRRLIAPSLFAFFLTILFATQLPAENPAELAPNGSFETGNADSTWPADWGQVKSGGSWEKEGGNHFIRLKSPEPGQMVMMYQELKLPPGTEALRLSWKQRVSNLKKGKNSWFDARIMLEFVDDQHQKLKPAPKPAATGKDTDGWQERQVEFLVPPGAYWLQFMPTLFQVETGTFDLDEISLQSIDPAPIRQEMEKRNQERQAKLAADEDKRRAKAQKILDENDSLIPNGSFQAKKGDLPLYWGKMSGAVRWENEADNTFLRIESPEAGKLAMLYRTYDIPKGTKALELSWKQRI
ncbi:hypothetical protein GC197_13695 [bacterium]|nr:hypothetical protein [bacterium]